MEATLLKRGNIIDLKIYDDTICHNFTINYTTVIDYSLLKSHGEPLAKSNAELVDIKDIDDHPKSIRIKTSVLEFEIVQDKNYRYQAYKRLLK